eukprot:COSAG06_NODE_26412_length_615_cov_1.319767_1_plen_98_part_10
MAATANKAAGQFKNQEEVCCLSSLLLLWVHPLLRAGWKGEMHSETMVPSVLGKLRCAGVTTEAQRLWAAERASTARPEPALWRALVSLCSRDLIIGTL